MIERLIVGEQGTFRSGRGCVNQTFTMKYISERKEEQIVCRFHGLITT